MPVVFVAASKLPTPFATFTMHGFLEEANGREHVVLSLGDIADGAPVLGRIHSECLTGDALFSQRCDCGSQLEAAMQAIAREGRGVLLVSGHFMTLEMCGRLLCDHVDLSGMYRKHRNPVYEWAVKFGRLRYAKAMYANEDIRATVRHLKKGGFLWYAPDQDMRGKDTVFVPFFGHTASTITATHQLARMTGCAVIPYFHRREGGKYFLKIGAPLENFPSEDVEADTARVNQAIEAMVREAPDQYLWIHRRFKRQPGGRSDYYK